MVLKVRILHHRITIKHPGYFLVDSRIYGFLKVEITRGDGGKWKQTWRLFVDLGRDLYSPVLKVGRVWLFVHLEAFFFAANSPTRVQGNDLMKVV